MNASTIEYYNKYTIYTQLFNYSMQLFKVKIHACDL